MQKSWDLLEGKNKSNLKNYCSEIENRNKNPKNIAGNFKGLVIIKRKKEKKRKGLGPKFKSKSKSSEPQRSVHILFNCL